MYEFGIEIPCDGYYYYVVTAEDVEQALEFIQNGDVEAVDYEVSMFYDGATIIKTVYIPEEPEISIDPNQMSIYDI